ncbi:hypothetical protein BKA66DRAFT_565285 [Pyrenochaeta sp. MPI-SDFR-AT-0127]|nr:hypothetical protein BKA66DRAFT_565285 [Pyrenochaeta sp. MPI-SDFR-AT-0127]
MRSATSFVLAALALSAAGVPTMMEPRGDSGTVGDKMLNQRQSNPSSHIIGGQFTSVAGRDLDVGLALDTAGARVTPRGRQDDEPKSAEKPPQGATPITPRGRQDDEPKPAQKPPQGATPITPRGRANDQVKAAMKPRQSATRISSRVNEKASGATVIARNPVPSTVHLDSLEK